MKPVVIVHNPIAGSGRAARLATRAAAELNRLGIAALQEPTAAQGDGTSIASAWEGRCRALLAVGGDGTLREVLQGLSGPETPLGVLPAGTSNLLAREFGLGPDPAEAARILAAARIRPLDLLRVESSQAPPRTALLCAGVGFDAGVVAEVAARRSRAVAAGRSGHLSKASYLLPGLRALLSWRPPDLTLTIDGCPVPGGPWGWVLAANTSLYAHGIRLGDRIRPDDGRLDLLALPAGSALAFLRFFLAAHLGIIERMTDLVRLTVRERVEISGTSGVPVQIDGDPADATPVTIGIEPGRVSLLVPG